MAVKTPSTPKAVWERPTVLIDSGQSVGESVFLDKLRQWAHQSISEHAHSFKVPSVWVVYPNEIHRPYHGAFPVNQYDKWEIRPIRWRNRKLDQNGMLATAAMFEEGCHRKKIKAPWREHNSKGLRAVYVYLNPTRQDRTFGIRHWKKFRKVYNIPELVLGEPIRYGLPAKAHEWVSGIWTFQRAAAKRARTAYWNRFGYHLPWWKWWQDERESGKERPMFGIAEAFGDNQALRHPGLAQKWCNKEVIRPKDDKTWEALIGATWCRLYMIATTRESVPFDAMIAAARGATLVAPDVPIFRNIPGKHWLYPAHQAGDHILWNQTDVTTWILGKLQNGKQPRTTHYLRRP